MSRAPLRSAGAASADPPPGPTFLGFRFFPSAILPILVPALAGLVAGCASPEGETIPPFRYHLVTAPVTFDPALAFDHHSTGVVDRLFDGLMRMDRVTGLAQPELASDFSISADGLVYTFRLRPEARFHNGRRILASDFVYSWERLLDPEIRAPMAWLLATIAGAEEFLEGEASQVVGIEAEDPEVLRVRLRQPFAGFLDHLAQPAAGVVPREAVDRLGARFGHEPVGSGPYRFRSMDATEVRLTAFAEHFRPPRAVRDLSYVVVPDFEDALSRYRQGELDLVGEITFDDASLGQEPFADDLRLFPGMYWFGFCFRCDRPPFEDSRVRRAFAAAVDRDALVRALGVARHTASVGFLPHGIPGHDPATLQRGWRVEWARDLLAEAGYPGGAGFPAQSLYYLDRDSGRAIFAALEQGLRELGVRIRAEPMALEANLLALEEGTMALFELNWGGEYLDPEPYLYPLFHSRGSANFSFYRNPEVDRSLDAARGELDRERRLGFYRRAQQLILEDAPCVALYHRSEAILLKPGWQNLPIGYFSSSLEIERIRWREE